MDFKNMSDSELAGIMVNYISRISHLQDMIARHLDGSDNGSIPAERIKETYRQIKGELRADANYLNKVSNRRGSDLYMYTFSKSIKEAAANGFTVATNSSINQAMHSAVEEAHYRMRKYKSYEAWGNLM